MKTYNIFISHSWAYGDIYDKLIEMLDKEPRFSYKNYSVPKDDPVHNAPNIAALAQAIRDRVRFCDAVLVLAGVYSTYSKWINREIDIAQQFTTPKPIIAIEPWNSEKTSKFVKDNADKIVGWNTSPIVSAIRELA